MSDLDEIRQKRMAELQAQQAAMQNQAQQQAKLTKPELVNQIELQLIQSAQAGSLRGKVTDEQLKVLLRQIAGQKREIKITRK